MKTRAKYAAGPTVDSAFFNDLAEVFSRYPNEARKYAIRTMTLETDVLHIDFNKQHAVSNVEGNRIITEFHDRSEKVRSAGPCCEWVENGLGGWKCNHLCEV